MNERRVTSASWYVSISAIAAAGDGVRDGGGDSGRNFAWRRMTRTVMG